MRMRANPVTRPGFTLVEILVVIAIIATLAALLLGAISRVKEVGNKTVAIAEISQLETAIAKFKQDNGFSPPQYAEIPKFVPNPAVDNAQLRTYRLLKKMFRGYGVLPNGAEMNPGDSLLTPGGDPTAISHYADFQATVNSPPTQVLTGIESVAYFLAGPRLKGFKANLPTDGAGSNSARVIYYTFNADKFIDPDTKAYTNQYRDAWGTPYAYFSTVSGKDYTATYSWQIPSRPGVFLGPFRTGGLTNSPWAAPGGIQIISAGPDKEFGTFFTGSMRSGEWIPGQGEYTDTSATGYGADDISNFNYGVPLGVKAK